MACELYASRNRKERAMSSGTRPKSVFVNAYQRRRFGRLEHVRSHYRSHPDQLFFDF